MRREIGAVLGVGAALAFTGCGSRPENHDTTEPSGPKGLVEVTNTLDEPIGLSSSPTEYSQQTRTGELGAGQTAVASCIVYDYRNPKNSEVRVDYRQTSGYIGVYTAANDKIGQQPTQELSVGIKTLRSRLIDCATG